MKCGGLSVDALLKCRCASAGTPCALLREDGSARHASNASGDLVTRFRDSILYGASACAGGAVCSSAGVGSVPMDASGNAAANARLAAQLRVSRRDVGRRVTHEALLEAAYAPCAAQVLATHQSMASLAARPYWAGSHFVTVLREPVARVWSFYQYVRRKSIEFQDKPLLVFLERWRTFTPNATAASGGSSPHWHWQLSNMMTAQLAVDDHSSFAFASAPGGDHGGGGRGHAATTARGSRRVSDFGTELLLSGRRLSGRRLGSELPFAARLERQREMARGPSPSQAALAIARQAQHALLRMDVVGLTEDMEGFERALRARWPDTFGRKGTSRCSIPSGAAARNPTSQHTVRGNASTALDEATRAAIRSLNQLDLRVYDLAKAIAASQAECVARVAKLDEAGGQRGREARRCFAAVRAKLQNRGAVL